MDGGAGLDTSQDQLRRRRRISPDNLLLDSLTFQTTSPISYGSLVSSGHTSIRSIRHSTTKSDSRRRRPCCVMVVSISICARRYGCRIQFMATCPLCLTQNPFGIPCQVVLVWGLVGWVSSKQLGQLNYIFKVCPIRVTRFFP